LSIQPALEFLRTLSGLGGGPSFEAVYGDYRPYIGPRSVTRHGIGHSFERRLQGPMFISVIIALPLPRLFRPCILSCSVRLGAMDPGTRPLMIAGIAVSAFVSLMVLAPLISLHGTYRGLDGTPGVLDGGWGDGPFAVLYAFGDLFCHQQFSRSFVINGSQMPVCMRDTGLAAGFAAGLLSCALLSSFARGRTALTAGCALIPVTAAEWAWEHTGADSPVLRTVSGFVSGWGVAAVASWSFLREDVHERCPPSILRRRCRHRMPGGRWGRIRYRLLHAGGSRTVRAVLVPPRQGPRLHGSRPLRAGTHPRHHAGRVQDRALREGLDDLRPCARKIRFGSFRSFAPVFRSLRAGARGHGLEARMRRHPAEGRSVRGAPARSEGCCRRFGRAVRGSFRPEPVFFGDGFPDFRIIRAEVECGVPFDELSRALSEDSGIPEDRFTPLLRRRMRSAADSSAYRYDVAVWSVPDVNSE